ncbi:glycosyltransferase family 2 protein [Kineococcus sp. SYSU DK004]|uniref:glycosyltransferase family 2 protein n=1 Tax=Kineococcus sp. SYSU DK004 TaxID=3383125 RepID=UPI003D7E31A5
MNPLLPITLTIVLFLGHSGVMFALSRTTRARTADPPRELVFVVLVPCLDEGVVIDRSLARLRASAPGNVLVLVVDDGSTDATADLVLAHAREDPRVHLLRRRPPHARRGKGEALNAAYRHVCDSDIVAGHDPRDVVVVVLDADGRPAPGMFEEAARSFADPRCGGAQVGVRMYNVEESLLARMQDLEFVAFTEVYQRARTRVGSVGLGGNGQFTRLSALQQLGRAPWTPCLTEDLDLGLRLLALGWRNDFCPGTYVAQQAVLSPRRLVRQRSRWFQGHLQCLRRVPLVVSSPLGVRTSLDLLHHLTAPFVILLTSVLPPLLLGWVVLSLLDTGHPLVAFLATEPLVLLGFYAITFALAPVLGYVYWTRTPVPLRTAMAYAHLYVLYAWLWYLAGWWAVLRVARGQRTWAKTARTRSAETLVVDEQPAA